MRYFLLLFIISPCITPAQSAYNCTACENRKCRQYVSPCPGHKAIDPCGCCVHCAKQNGEPCGGPDWELGYCDKNLKCAAIAGKGLAEIPAVGVCKALPGDDYKHYFEDDDENCPVQKRSCYRATGMCDCPDKRTCIYDFFQYSVLYCDPRYDSPDYEHLFERPCTRSGCDIVNDTCACTSGGCDRTFEFSDGRKCYQTLIERLCANVTCPEPEVLKCPPDSVVTTPHTPYGECCPTIPSNCTCDFGVCNNECPKGRRKIMIREADGIPGRCCDKFMCLL